MQPTRPAVHVTPASRDGKHKYVTVSTTWTGEPTLHTPTSTHDTIPWGYKPTGTAWDTITLDREPRVHSERVWVRDDLLTRLAPGGTFHTLALHTP